MCVSFCFTGSGSSQLSANFLAISQLMVNFNKSLLIFPQFYILAFSIQKNFKRIHQLVSDVQRRLQHHDCFWWPLNNLAIVNVKIVLCNSYFRCRYRSSVTTFTHRWINGKWIVNRLQGVCTKWQYYNNNNNNFEELSWFTH